MPKAAGSGRSLRAVVFHPDDGDGRLMVAEATRRGLCAERFWPCLPAIVESCAVVATLLTHVDDEAALATLATPDAAAIAILATESPLLAEAAVRAGACGVLVAPLRPAAVAGQLMLALSQRAHVSRLQARIARLEENLRTRRQIEKATRLLTAIRGISQKEAYEQLRQAATARRRPLAELATAMTEAADLFVAAELPSASRPAAAHQSGPRPDDRSTGNPAEIREAHVSDSPIKAASG
ncbi:MAG TPA: ANTAR domain-containing protein [Hyphomicrobiales bacterium]|nr:ANTAR domain-containing protein [Hyphomicrobiales bacterium]